ncbi:MAG: Rrf2 family transcriptional regulator, partial [Candidatus Omnitrophica bacterium]|nr:Rrf2 family transcriptional regulator [Candidatus Omnitrophota bacterium]
MKLITRDTDYALRALCFIAKNKDKVTPAPELVAKLKIPRPFLRKILQSLDKNGLLKSYKGKGGGFVMT